MSRVFFALVLGVGGCASNAGDTAGKSDEGESLRPPCTDCVLDDALNYHFSSALTVDVVPGAVDQTPVIDWSGFTTDIHGHRVGTDFVPEDVMLLVFLELDPEGVTADLESDTLLQQDISLFATCDPEGTSCSLADFRVLGQDIDLEQYYFDGYGTWLALLRSDFEAGAHTMVFLPPAAGGATEVPLGDDSANLDVDVDFHSSEVLVVGSGPDASFSWSLLSVVGQGNELSVQSIDHLMLARYDATIEELEGQVFDLERIPDERHDLSVSGRTSASLAEIKPDGQLFDDGTWLLALQCSLCSNPAPKFVTQVVFEAAP